MSVVEKKLKLADLKEHQDNPRQIDEDKLEELKDSIEDFPEMMEARPIVVNSDMQIIGGNQRYKALLALGKTEDMIKVVDWDEAKQREFMLKDNEEKGEWNYSMLLSDWKTEDLSKWGVSVGIWTPTLDPSSQGNDVTSSEIERTQSDLENRFTNATEGEKIEITCSNCHETYYVDK